MALADLRQALATNLRRIDAVQVSPFVLADPNLPTIQLLAPGPIDYDLAMGRGLDTVGITIQALVALNEGEASQRQMDRFAEATGEGSIKAAAEYDPTLGGWAEQIRVVSCGGVSLSKTIATGVDVLLAEWLATVYVKGTV